MCCMLFVQVRLDQRFEGLLRLDEFIQSHRGAKVIDFVDLGILECRTSNAN